MNIGRTFTNNLDPDVSILRDLTFDTNCLTLKLFISKKIVNNNEYLLILKENNIPIFTRTKKSDFFVVCVGAENTQFL